jgi:hypothetical protein
MGPLTATELAEIAKRAEDATPTVKPSEMRFAAASIECEELANCVKCVLCKAADLLTDGAFELELLCEARTDIPRLLADLRAARETLKRLAEPDGAVVDGGRVRKTIEAMKAYLTFYEMDDPLNPPTLRQRAAREQGATRLRLWIYGLESAFPNTEPRTPEEAEAIKAAAAMAGAEHASADAPRADSSTVEQPTLNRETGNASGREPERRVFDSPSAPKKHASADAAVREE